MQNNWNHIIKSAALGNVLHLLLSLLYSYGKMGNVLFQYSMLSLVLFMWLTIGFRFGFILNDKSEKSLMMISFVSLLPIMLFLIACQSLEGLSNLNNMQNYSMFYFIGTPIIFWNKPFIPIMNLFKNSSIYIQLDINAAVVFFIILIGGYLGFYIKKKISSNQENSIKKV